MKIVLVIIVMAALTVAPLMTDAKAFCLWNCDAQKVKESGPMYLDCQRFQFENGQYSLIIKYCDVNSDGKIKSWADGRMITEDELKRELKDHPDVYDLTPQLMEKMYQESIK